MAKNQVAPFFPDTVYTDLVFGVRSLADQSSSIGQRDNLRRFCTL